MYAYIIYMWFMDEDEYMFVSCTRKTCKRRKNFLVWEIFGGVWNVCVRGNDGNIDIRHSRWCVPKQRVQSSSRENLFFHRTPIYTFFFLVQAAKSKTKEKPHALIAFSTREIVNKLSFTIFCVCAVLSFARFLPFLLVRLLLLFAFSLLLLLLF